MMLGCNAGAAQHDVIRIPADRCATARTRIGRAALPLAALLVFAACAHRYSEDPRDWVGPRKGDFAGEFAECRTQMDEAPFRFGGDVRLIFLRCMKDRGWILKERF